MPRTPVSEMMESKNTQNGSVQKSSHLPDPEQNAGLKSVGRLQRSAFRALVQDFSPIWFTWCMNAGAIGTLLHQLPYQFPGLPVLSTIAFIIDLVLYVIFSVIYILRFAMFTKQAYHELVGTVSELCLFPCWSIAWMTLVSFVSLSVSDAAWGGYSFTVVACVMWWIATAWMFSALFFAFVTLIRQHNVTGDQLPVLIIIPAVGVSTLALVGGVVASFSTGISSGAAVPIIVMSICAVGVGILLGLILYTYLFHQLLAKGWPAPPQTATLFILVGPMGQSAAALQLLGGAANVHGHFQNYNKGIFLTGEAAAFLETTCVLLALLMTGLGAVWLVIALCAMLDRAYNRELIWSPAWNAIIFPTATLATSTLILGTNMDSSFFKVVTVILVLCLIIVFLVNAAFSIWKILYGELLIIREDPRVRAQLKQK